MRIQGQALQELRGSHQRERHFLCVTLLRPAHDDAHASYAIAEHLFEHENYAGYDHAYKKIRSPQVLLDSYRL